MRVLIAMLSFLAALSANANDRHFYGAWNGQHSVEDSRYVHPKDRRSRAVAKEFQRLHPCPATGKKTGACPGWIKDHIKPLCAGGRDHPSNMQWQTVRDAALKDKDEYRLCRSLR